LALTMMLPAGVKGMLLSVCLMGIIAGDGIHLHSWGSIFIQDVLLPLRRKPLTPRQHIRWLRLSIVGVAAWAFLFGALFPKIEYVQLWWGITEAIFVSGAGVAIIGGLYWSRGTNAAAWSALIVGSTLACGGIGAQLYYQQVLHRDLMVPIGNYSLYLNIPKICFFDSMIAIACYGVLSWLTCRAPHDMDRLLHRGDYGAQGEAAPPAGTGKKPFWFYRVVTFGIDAEFSRSDRWVTIGITLWSMFWFGVFAVGSVVYLVHPWSDNLWAAYWLWTAVYLPLAISAVTTVWFTWGCSHDMVAFFRRLRSQRVDERDDGTVDRDQAPVRRGPVAAEAPMGKG
jgi:SSS family solute:Na+ symporter